MSVMLDCPPCGERITAADEDELVATTQAHARSEHQTELSREEILALVVPS